ncbi:MAG TPA: hypothetical protein VGE60_09240 [Telluria sp.]
MTERAPMTLAQRREALVALCALQRREAGAALQAIRAPVSKPADMLASLRARFGGRLALPLAVAGAALGLLAVRRKGLIPMVVAAAGAWKTVRPLLATLRQARSASLDPDKRPL